MLFLYTSKLSKTSPVPLATQSKGSSATKQGTPIDRTISSSRLRSKAPPPDIIIPLSIISADSSGGVSLKTALTTWIISDNLSEIASQTSLEEILMFWGSPEIKSLPRISISLSSPSAIFSTLILFSHLRRICRMHRLHLLAARVIALTQWCALRPCISRVVHILETIAITRILLVWSANGLIFIHFSTFFGLPLPVPDPLPFPSRFPLSS